MERSANRHQAKRPSRERDSSASFAPPTPQPELVRRVRALSMDLPGVTHLKQADFRFDVTAHNFADGRGVRVTPLIKQPRQGR